ncbi:hypothetical protein ENBRE01_2207 [Enteropsectra breve]|nr:hypothetical protein ENBRE01_2207 [Enteropsectra breve]
MRESEEQDTEIRQRGRPRKQQQIFRFGPHVYATPLGFQYTQPMLYANEFKNVSTNNLRIPPPPAVSPIFTERKQRKAAVKLLTVKRKKRHTSEDSNGFSESNNNENYQEEDLFERLLEYDEENKKYLVKIRNKSYLHCEWIPEDEIKATRVGAMKVKRYKLVGLDPRFVQVERVLAESYENNEKIVLIKWKGLPYEQGTWELFSVAEKCDFFNEELVKFRDRKKMRHMKMALEWRPSREQQQRYEETPGYKNNNSLRSYQLEGLNWLLNRWYYKQSCIMADEMGLGKTVQSVVFVNALFEAFDYSAPALVVAPLSTIVHWERTFENWTNLRVLTYHGSIADRQIISNYEFNVKAGNISIRLFDVIITTYEMAMAGSEHLCQFEFGLGIFDEAHRLKNVNSKAASCLRNFNICHKVLLSGTPIQNNINELWALFNFIDPLRFNNLNKFLEEFKMNKSEDVEKLQAVLKPLMLRRMKEDVETSIPMKEETIIEVELTSSQKRYYRAILEKNIEFLTKGDKSNAPNLINAMMELRKCCIHPYLLKGAEEKIIADYMKKKQRSDTEIFKAPENSDASENKITVGDFTFDNSEEYYKILIQSSGKLVLLDKLLNKLKGEHKVLIFSQMTKCLDLLAEYLVFRKYKHERIDGGVRGDMRQAAIDRFTTGDAFVFLLCTRAGGVGINLTAADTVIIFDSDWNPQNDLQAQARCHRIGQKNEVKIYRLITRNSYEREMFDKAGLKLGLDRAVLQKMSFDQKEDTPAKKEDAIQLLLRKGAYGVLMDTDEAAMKFCEEDIDQILERRTKIVKHSDGGNVFSKASFQVEEEIEDPDFWDNLLSQKKSEEKEGRIKRQCRRLAREGVISPEAKMEISDLCLSLGGAIKLIDKKTSKKSGFTDAECNNIFEENSEDYEITLFRIFITALDTGIADTGISLFGAKNEALGQLIKYCMDLIENNKLKNDFGMYLERFPADYDPNMFVKYADVYLRFHEQFLFRIQVPMILESLRATEDMVVEKMRGWNHEDDRNIVDMVLSRGYDNFTYKERSKEEINQRIRKIITVLYHRREMRDNDNMFFKTILNFGRQTERNEYAIEKFLKKDTKKLRELMEKILTMSRRSRRDTPEADCYDRIIFFDRLENLTEIPAIRKGSGMPKKWDSEKDAELREHLLEFGFVGVYEKYGVTEDTILKRFESLFKAGNPSVSGKD